MAEEHIPCFGLKIGKGSPIFQKKYKNTHQDTKVNITRTCPLGGTEKTNKSYNKTCLPSGVYFSQYMFAIIFKHKLEYQSCNT